MFSPLCHPSAPHPSTLQHFPPPLVHVHVCTYKFFDFSVSYTILNLSPSILGLPIMLLIPCTFPHPNTSPPSPHWKPSMWSPFLWFHSCSNWLSFGFCFLGSVVDSCEFVMIIVFDLLSLRKVPLTFHIIRAWRWWTPLTWPYLGSTWSALPF